MEGNPFKNEIVSNYNQVLQNIKNKVQDHVKSIWVDDAKVTHEKVFYLLATRGTFFLQNALLLLLYFFFFFFDLELIYFKNN